MVQGLKFIEHSRQLNYGKHSPFFIRSCSQLLVSIDQNFKYAWKKKKKKFSPLITLDWSEPIKMTLRRMWICHLAVLC